VYIQRKRNITNINYKLQKKTLQEIFVLLCADNRVRPQRAAIVDLDRQRPKTPPTPPPPTPPPPPPAKKSSSSERGSGEARGRRAPTTSYRIPGKTFGDWLQGPEERARRRMIVS